MFDDGTVLFLQIMYTLIAYTHELWFFFYRFALYNPFGLPRYLKPKVDAYGYKGNGFTTSCSSDLLTHGLT